MKQTLLFLAILLTGFSLNAQVVTVAPTDVVVSGQYDLSDNYLVIKAESEMTNVSAGDVSLKWEIIEIDAPTKWDIQLCDKNNCYPFNQLSNVDPANNLNVPVDLMPDSISILDPAIRVNNTEGTGIYEVRVFSVDDMTTPLVTNTYTFNINVTSLDEVEKASIKIYPNPVVNSFSIKNIDKVQEVEVYNIVGKKMATFETINSKTFDVSDLPVGLYLVRMIDNDGDVIKTSRLTKK